MSNAQQMCTSFLFGTNMPLVAKHSILYCTLPVQTARAGAKIAYNSIPLRRQFSIGLALVDIVTSQQRTDAELFVR